MIELLLISAIVLLIYITVWYGVARITGRNDVLDIAWGGGFLLLIAVYIWRVESFTMQMLVVTPIVFLWGSRIVMHGVHRFGKRKEEDFRYAKLREIHKHPAQEYFKLFLGRGALILLASLSVMTIFASEAQVFGTWQIIGVIIWLWGFFIEIVADRQMRKFRQDEIHKGRLLMSGLWKYSRHPNYFGEMIQWWGVFLLSVGTGYTLLALIAPITVMAMILKIFGIPALEEKYKDDEEFQEYASRTNALIMWEPLPATKSQIKNL